MGNNDAFMEDFGNSLNDEGDPHQMKTARNAADALDVSLQAPNANDFSNARLIEEVRNWTKTKILLCETLCRLRTRRAGRAYIVWTRLDFMHREHSYVNENCACLLEVNQSTL